MRSVGPDSTRPTDAYPYFTGPGKSPSWKGQRIAVRWLSGTRPRKTRLSVPRLTPLFSARTRTSSDLGGESDVSRISPRPGSTVQNARARSAIEVAFDHD